MSENRLENIKKRFWVNAEKLMFDDDGLKEAIEKAVGDLMVRTLKRRSNTENAFITDLCSGNKSLLFLLKEWFETDVSSLNDDDFKKNFDSWHIGACENVLDVLQKHYTNKDGSDVCYGKAQKIVNMTFKYLYCIPGFAEKEKHFKYCHVALDTFTLEWLYRKSKEKNLPITRDNLVPWSNISAAESKVNGKEIYTYSKLQGIFADLVKVKKEQHNLTPFQAEFYIWPQMQLTLACEHLYSLQSKEKLNEFKKNPLNEKLKELNNCINSIHFDENIYFI